MARRRGCGRAWWKLEIDRITQGDYYIDTVLARICHPWVTVAACLLPLTVQWAVTLHHEHAEGDSHDHESCVICLHVYAHSHAQTGSATRIALVEPAARYADVGTGAAPPRSRRHEPLCARAPPGLDQL